MTDTACSSPAVTLAVGVCSALSYSLTYFWRYPIFLLPKAFLEKPVVTLGGRSLDLQACLSLAFVLGFVRRAAAPICRANGDRSPRNHVGVRGRAQPSSRPLPL